MKQVLLLEHIHADAVAYHAAAASLRREGRLMLKAILHDLSKAENVIVTVALCPQAVIDLDLSGNVLTMSSPSLLADDLADQIQKLSPAIDTVLLIAPEIGHVLPRLVRSLRWRGVPVMGPRTEVIEACSDKWQTYELLQRSGLPTIPTELPENLQRLNLTPDQACIVKPRDGAGCEGVFLTTLRDVSRRLVSDSSSAPGLVIQPKISGRTLSVGMIGQGAGRSPLFLPLATQRIMWNAGRPKYLGGQIPETVPPAVQDDLKSLVNRIAWTLQLEEGYVGIDLLLPENSEHLLITEINPRLCSSYVGYRKATDANLAEWMLHLHPTTEVTWHTTPISFDMSPA